MPKWGVPPKKGTVHLLHASPPCQSLSKLNMFSDEGSIENKLFPILEQVCFSRTFSFLPPHYPVEMKVWDAWLHSCALRFYERAASLLMKASSVGVC